MKSTKHLLQVRAKMKAHQPLFVVKESHKSARVGRRWRANRGIHSGQRQMHRGKPSMPTPGFGVPRLIKGLHSSGLQFVIVHTLSQLETINPQTQGVLIGSTVGQRKKLQILDAAVKKKITLFQTKDANKTIESIRSSFAVRIKVKKDRQSLKSKKEAERKKKAGDKKKKEEAKTAPSEQGQDSIEDAVKEEKDQEKDHEHKEAEKTLIKPQ